MNLIQAYISDLSVDNYGNQYTAFLRNQHELVKGAPMGRGSTADAAVADLERRVKLESNVKIDWVDA